MEARALARFVFEQCEQIAAVCEPPDGYTSVHPGAVFVVALNIVNGDPLGSAQAARLGIDDHQLHVLVRDLRRSVLLAASSARTHGQLLRIVDEFLCVCPWKLTDEEATRLGQSAVQVFNRARVWTNTESRPKADARQRLPRVQRREGHARASRSSRRQTVAVSHGPPGDKPRRSDDDDPEHVARDRGLKVVGRR